MLIIAMSGMTLCADVRAACPTVPLEDQFATSVAVFVGRAVARRVVESTEAPGGRFTETTFKVEDVWKGPSGTTMRVRTCGGTIGDESVTCGEGFTFDVGGRYVVFAFGEPLETSACQATERVDRAVQTLRWLSKKPHRKAG